VNGAATGRTTWMENREVEMRGKHVSQRGQRTSFNPAVADCDSR